MRLFVNETAYCCNNIVLILMAIISSKKVCEKMENNSTLEKVLLVCNRKAKLLRLVDVTFDCKMAFLRRIRTQNLLILKSLPFLVLLVCRCWHLSFQVSIKSVFYCAIFNWNFIWNIDLNNGVYCDLRNKSACLTTVFYYVQTGIFIKSIFVFL